MQITDEIVDAFLRCETKAYLKSTTSPGAPSELSRWQQGRREEYRAECRELLVTGSDGQWCSGTPDLESLQNHRYQLIFDYVVGLAGIHVRLDAVVLHRGRSKRLDCPYMPVRFVPFEKFSANDKLLLAFDAFAFSQARGKKPHAGRIIYGRNHAVANIQLSDLLRKIQRIIRAIEDQQTQGSPPVALNKHCAECEFQTRCREAAMQKDAHCFSSNEHSP